MKLITYKLTKMKILNIRSFKIDKNLRTVIGIGKFDGFHIGHQKIVKEIINLSHQLNCIPCVFTFRDYPFDTTLSLWDEKLEAFRENSIEICLWADFFEIHKLTPQDFLNMMNERCNMAGIVVGENFRFGFRREGDISYLKSWAVSGCVEVRVVKTVIIDNRVVSSSEIKRLIKNSDFFHASLFLGRWFTIEGSFIKGRGIGKTIGFPTINIDVRNKNSPLQNGVYACTVIYKGELFKAVAFYGSSPTFKSPLSLEIHIIEDKSIVVDEDEIFSIIPVKKIREIKRFSNVEDLANQIRMDVKEAMEILNSFNFDKILSSA